MESEVMLTVLIEMLEEQKKVIPQAEKQTEVLEGMSQRIADLEDKLDQVNVAPPSVNLLPTQLLLAEKMEEIKKMIAAQPKQVVQEKRYLFFPEHRAAEYYGVIFRWLLFMLMVLCACFLLNRLVDRI